MIEFVQGNLLEAQADALVNAVNTEGVMGKGIAQQFKKRFPRMYSAYRQACIAGEVQPGKMHVFDCGIPRPQSEALVWARIDVASQGSFAVQRIQGLCEWGSTNSFGSPLPDPRASLPAAKPASVRAQTDSLMRIEICVDSVEGAIAAERGGADRVELCDNLLEGGTTPSAGCIKLARARIRIGLQVIIRPRGGDFLYTPTEFEVITEDVCTAKSLGADGIVIGCLTAAGDIDLERTRALIALARPLNVTFHRAFDMCRDPKRALEELIELGVDRVLTSGQESTCLEGQELMAQLHR